MYETYHDYTYQIISLKDGAGFVAIVDGWYRTQIEHSIEMARHAARIFISGLA